MKPIYRIDSDHVCSVECKLSTVVPVELIVPIEPVVPEELMKPIVAEEPIEPLAPEEPIVPYYTQYLYNTCKYIVTI